VTASQQAAPVLVLLVPNLYHCYGQYEQESFASLSDCAQPAFWWSAAPSLATAHIWSRGMLSGGWRCPWALIVHACQCGSSEDTPCPEDLPAAPPTRALAACAALFAQPTHAVEEGHPALLGITQRLAEQYLLVPEVQRRMRQVRFRLVRIRTAMFACWLPHRWACLAGSAAWTLGGGEPCGQLWGSVLLLFEL
jgi:hypothetical protein